MHVRRIATVGPIGIDHELNTALAGSSIDGYYSRFRSHQDSLFGDRSKIVRLGTGQIRSFGDRSNVCVRGAQKCRLGTGQKNVRLGTGQMSGHLDLSV